MAWMGVLEDLDWCMMRSRVKNVLLFVGLALACLWPWRPATALLGGVEASSDPLAQHMVMLVSTRGSICGAAVIDARTVLTAGHCVANKADYAVIAGLRADAPLIRVARVRYHQRFDKAAFEKRRVSVDLALLTLEKPLPDFYHPVLLEAPDKRPMVGERLRVYGYGLEREDDDTTVGVLRRLDLQVVAPLSRVQLRLVDPQNPPRRGSCRGDSGGPIFRDGRLVGVISWAVGANGAAGCGGMTGGALILDHAGWIKD